MSNKTQLMDKNTVPREATEKVQEIFKNAFS